MKLKRLSLAAQFCPPILLPGIRRMRAEVSRRFGRPEVRGEQSAEWYDDYYSTYEEYSKPFYLSAYYPLWAVITDRLVRNGIASINDIGCGAGQFAELLKYHGIAKYRGLDISEKAINLAKARELGYDFQVCDVVAALPDDLGEFSCTVSLEFLEHVDQDLDVMSTLPDGQHFFGTVPNFPFVSHVRYFEAESDVETRYGKYFRQLSVSRHMGRRAGQLFFLMDGVIGQKT